MRRSRKRIFLLLSILLVVGLVGGYFGGKYALRLRVQRWRDSGIAAAKAGDHAKAVDLLVRYIQRRGAYDTEALDYYIRSREAAEMANGQHLAETVSAIRLLLGTHPDRVDQQFHLLQLYDRLDNRPEAIDTANALLKQKELESKAGFPGARAQVLRLKTEILMRMQQYRDALQAAGQWVAVAPDDFHAHLSRLRARRELADQVRQPKDDLIDDARKLLDAHPQDPRFELILGFAYAQSDDEEKAAKAADEFRKAAAHPKLDDDLAQELVAQFDAAGMGDDSIVVLQQLVRNGAGPEIRRALGERLWQMGHWAEAADALSHVTTESARANTTLLALKAIALAGAGKKTDSDACRAALSGLHQVAAARAWTLILNRVLDSGTPDDRQIVGECRSALAVDRSNAYLLYYCGDAQARLGETDLAIAAWRAVVLNDPTWVNPGIRLVEALLQKGQSKQALWFASTIVKRNPTQAAAVIMLARAWSVGIETGGMAPADELLKFSEGIQQIAPGEDQTLLLRVQLLGRKGDKTAAANAIRDMLAAATPAREPVLLTLASLSRRYGLKCETEIFQRYEKVYGVTAALAFKWSFDDFATGDGPGGLKRFDELYKRRKDGADLPWQLERAHYLDVINSPDARASWVALGDAYPKDLTVQRAAVEARSTKGDWDFQTRTIERLKALAAPGGLYWRLAQARLYIEGAREGGDDYEQGALLLNKILAEQPKSVEAHVLLARALMRLKRTDGAIQHFSDAAKLDPTSVPIALELASVLQSRGDFERVNRELDRIAPQLRSSAERRQAALILARQGKSDQAVQLLETPAVNGESADEQNDLMLAILYRQQGQYDRAEQVVQKLLQHPDLATVQFAATMFASLGRPQDAEQALAKLDGLKLDAGIKELTWGTYFAQIGDLEKAIDRFKAAAKIAAGNPVPWRMAALCNLGIGKPKDCIAIVEEGCRALATNPEFATLQQHAALFAEAAADPARASVAAWILRDPSSSETCFELLRIVSDGRRSTSNESLASQLAQFAERHPDSLPCQVQLVQAYMEMGKQTDAVETALRACKTFPGPEAAELAVRAAGASGRWRELQDAAELWKARAPAKAASADQEIARAQLGLGRFDAALSQVKPYLPVAKAKPDTYPDVLSTCAVALANTGAEQDALTLLWPLVETSPTWRTRWVQAALSLRDTAMAARWLDRLATALPEREVADRAMLAEAFGQLGSKTQDPQLKNKASALYAAIAADPQAGARALLSAAIDAERQTKFTDAEAFYRRALALDPTSIYAKNNLAMLLAGHGGDLAEAERLASETVAALPRHAGVRDTLAFVEGKRRQFAQAAQSEQVAVELEPDNLTWRVRRAQYLLDSGDVVAASNALRSIEEARLDSRKAPDEVQKQLAAIRNQLGRSKSL